MAEIWPEIRGLLREAFMRGVHKLVDVATGKRWEVRPKGDRATGYDDHWSLLFDRGGRRLAAMSDLTALDFRLLLLLVSGDHKLDFVTFRPLAQREIADWLSVSQSTISRSMKRLVDRDVVERADYRGGGTRPSGYRLSPTFFWRGTAGQYWQAQDKRQRDRPATAEPEAERGELPCAGAEEPPPEGCL